MGTSQREVLHMYALIGANDHSGEPQDWKKWPQYLEKRKEERKSNIFSTNYSVGTVLCTVECPGSGMAWWGNTGAKPHPPHIVLSVDFPHSPVPIWRTSALPLPSWPGWPTARFLSSRSPSARGEAVWYKHMLSQGWGRVRSSRMPQDLDYQRLLLQISVFFLLIQSGWKIPQPGTNLSSCKVSELLSLCAISPGASAATLSVTWQSISRYTTAWLFFFFSRDAVPATHLTRRNSHSCFSCILSRETCLAAQIFFPWKACG